MWYERGRGEKSCSLLTRVQSTTLPRLCYDHGTSLPRWRRLHTSLNRFRRCLPRSRTFEVVSRCVFVTSRDLSINTKFNFSDTHFCFKTGIVTMNSVHNSELLLPLCLLQGMQALFDEQVALLMLMVRRIRCTQCRGRRRSSWVHP